MNSNIPQTRDEVIEILARSLLVNNMGYLVGAGLSRDLTMGTLAPAPNWKQLLQRVAGTFGLPTTDADLFPPGMSMPQAASSVCAKVAANPQLTPPSLSAAEKHNAATIRLKREIADACYFTRDQNKDAAYRSALSKARPSWIITTNYDVLLEELIPDSAALVPGQVLLAPSHSIPIYHLHGHRINPESVVITEEDYVHLFSPGEYRLLKLSVLFSESVTLALGYGLGDVNVLTALQWSQQYHDGRTALAEDCGILIQAFWDPAHSSDPPYVGRHGEVVIPIDDIAGFVDLVGTRFQQLARQRSMAEKAAVAVLVGANALSKFAQDGTYRSAVIPVLHEYAKFGGLSRVLLFLDTAFDQIWTDARANGGFAHYATFASTIIEIAERWGDSAHPAMVGLIARRISNLAPHIIPLGTQAPGQAWGASAYWKQNRSRIPSIVSTQLARHADETGEIFVKLILP